MGFQASSADPCLFVATRDGLRVYLIVYVDDFLIGSESEAEIIRVQKQLSRHFEIVDLGDVKHFLGLEVQKEDDTFCVSLANYIDKLVARVGLSEAKEAGTGLSEEQGWEQNRSKMVRSIEAWLVHFSMWRCVRGRI
ncbi:uncharacterized protein LOC134203594 [Armigeres subalbatus]|uniref:uncharacterized protein LOC134203594 n=1 Tax=Armigeres subalbatus TaxID=124917 RepID=UPI002ED42649